MDFTAVDFSGPIPQEVTKIQASTATSSPLSTPPPTPPCTPPFLDQRFTPSYDTDYPPLPEGLTLETYHRDRAAAMVDNSRDEYLSTDRHIQSLSSQRRQQIAKARLIRGKYGVAARNPCDPCVRAGKDCRVLHLGLPFGPALRRSQGRMICARCTSGNTTKCNAL